MVQSLGSPEVQVPTLVSPQISSTASLHTRYVKLSNSTGNIKRTYQTWFHWFSDRSSLIYKKSYSTLIFCKVERIITVGEAYSKLRKIVVGLSGTQR